MEKIKSPSVAGKFYTADKEELLEELRGFEEKQLYECTSRAIIVPHAGYMYSGKLAYQGFEHLDKNVENIFIFAPSHYEPIDEVGVLSTYNKFSTPLGEMDVNQDINTELRERFGCKFRDTAFMEEHAIEVQLPFIQHFYNNVKIIPIITGHRAEGIEEILAHYYPDPKNAFVISSDLSHFFPDDKAKKIDTTTAQMIEMGEVENFSTERACGGIGVSALTNYAAQKGFSLIRVGLINSSHATGETRKVVGYGSWLLYEGERTKFIKEHFSSLILEAARRAIQGAEMFDVPPVLAQYGASFVTLEIDGELRGCIGSIIAHRPLINDVIQNAYAAANADPRFLPVPKEDIPRLSIAVSLLSTPVEINFRDEEDLLSQIVPNEDGIIIKDGQYQAVYLPSVWEQIPDKTLFLNSLKQKAGLEQDYFSPTFQAFRYRTEYIK